MDTPVQLRYRLAELGIRRNIRTLTDWREKGLLPRLDNVGAGRGQGIKRYWSDEVLDQAIAAHLLMERYDRADDTLLGLWLAGYSIDDIAAQLAWSRKILRLHKRRNKAASRFRGSFIGLGNRWSRKLFANPIYAPLLKGYPNDYPALFREFVGNTEEWLHDDAATDEFAYRDLISEIVIKVAKVDESAVREFVDKAWKSLNPSAVIVTRRYAEFVDSLTPTELRSARASLCEIADAVRHLANVALANSDRVNSVRIPLLVMSEMLGTVMARLVILASRNAPEMPIRESISLLLEPVEMVQSIDIYNKTTGEAALSERLRAEWGATKERLAQLWEMDEK